MTSNVFVVGVNRQRTPLEIREELSFTRDEARLALMRLAAIPGIVEVLVLSTCNRTEIYAYGAPETGIPAIVEALREVKPNARALWKNGYRFVETGDAVVRHLFRVAAGIDSQILGDTQIVAQVKEAFEMARGAGTLGAFLDRAITEALRAAKRARRETRIGAGNASVGGAVLRSIRTVFADTRELQVLLLGAGEAGRDIAYHLDKADLGRRVFSSRNPEKAGAMAHEFSGHAVAWDQVTKWLALSDVLVTATSGRLHLLDREAVSKAAAQKRNVLIVDAGNPRNIDPSIAEVPGVKLLNLEALSCEQDEALLARLREVPRVETILNSDLERWRNWRRRRAIPWPTDGSCLKELNKKHAGALYA